MSRPDKFPDCMALSSKREACLGYRETRTKLDLEEKECIALRAEIERLLAALGRCREIAMSGFSGDMDESAALSEINNFVLGTLNQQFSLTSKSVPGETK